MSDLWIGAFVGGALGLTGFVSGFVTACFVVWLASKP